MENLKKLKKDQHQQLNLKPNPEKSLLTHSLSTSFPLDKNICQLFQQVATDSPDAIAVEFEGASLTYRELDRKSDLLAAYLIHMGLQLESYVGLCLESDLDLIVGLLGIMKAGAVYLPLDPGYPKERLQYILEDAKPSVLITKSSLAHQCANFQGRVVFLDTQWQEIGNVHSANVIAPKPENLAYVIYTSGSTGNPKGVMIEHKGLVNVVLARMQLYPPKNKILLLNSIGFDMSIMIIFQALISGGTLHLPNYKRHIDVDDIAEMIGKHGISFLLCVPSLYTALLQKNIAFPTIKHVILGGEHVPDSLLDAHAKQASTSYLYNEYGPTEASICTTAAKIYDPIERKTYKVSIGKPLTNTFIYILDENLLPVQEGLKGEMCIGGIGLARGYLNKAALTAEKFVAVDLSGNSERDVLYRTGDFGRFLPNGDIEFLGRIDHQVKIRGYRIELGEIEYVLCQHPGVKEAVVIAREDHLGNKQLAAYFTTQTQLAVDELRSFLNSALPKHMVPSYFKKVDQFTLTINGKIDRKVLPDPFPANNDNREQVLPGSSLENELLNIWKKTLNRDQIGIHDNFFDVGGDSILLAGVQTAINQLFGIKVPVVVLFQYPTISQLAQLLNAQKNSQSASQAIISKNKDASERKKAAFQRFKRQQSPGELKL